MKKYTLKKILHEKKLLNGISFLLSHTANKKKVSVKANLQVSPTCLVECRDLLKFMCHHSAVAVYLADVAAPDTVLPTTPGDHQGCQPKRF